MQINCLFYQLILGDISYNTHTHPHIYIHIYIHAHTHKQKNHFLKNKRLKMSHRKKHHYLSVNCLIFNIQISKVIIIKENMFRNCNVMVTSYHGWPWCTVVWLKKKCNNENSRWRCELKLHTWIGGSLKMDSLSTSEWQVKIKISERTKISTTGVWFRFVKKYLFSSSTWKYNFMFSYVRRF